MLTRMCHVISICLKTSHENWFPRWTQSEEASLQTMAAVQAMVGGAAAGAGRGVWNSKFDFSFAYFALTFGFQHLWRFPYLMFKNGGGEIRFVQKL